MGNKLKETLVGHIPYEWDIKTVEDLINENILYKPLDGNHGGIHPKQSDFVDSGIPFIMASDIRNGVLSYSNCKYISKEQAKNLKKGFSIENDVLLTHKATIGETAIVKKLNTEYIILTPQVTYYRVKDYNKINNIYLMYYFNYSKFKDLFCNWAGGGSTRAYLGITAQQKLPIVLPKIEEQRKIASILSSLDDKIELNNEMNKTLEEVAQAIFKAWFVDFEPFKDGEFEESELGMIPKGWRVSNIGDEFSILGGGTPKTKVDEYWNSDDVLWATPTDLTAQNMSVIDSTAKYISEEGLKSSSAKLLPKETIIMTSRATIGYCAITKKELSTNQGFINIVCDKYLSNAFMLYWIRRNLEQIINLANGSTFKEISKGTFKGIKIIVPDKETLDKYDNMINKIIDRIYNIKQQNDFLKTTRDSLLPKLISGEIRLDI